MAVPQIKRIKKVPMTDHKYSFMVSSVLIVEFLGLSSAREKNLKKFGIRYL